MSKKIKGKIKGKVIEFEVGTKREALWKQLIETRKQAIENHKADLKEIPDMIEIEEVFLKSAKEYLKIIQSEEN